MTMVKLQATKRNDGQLRYFITLPKTHCEMKKWKQGQKLELQFNERGNIELKE